jgi:hypothetical protein
MCDWVRPGAGSARLPGLEHCASFRRTLLGLALHTVAHAVYQYKPGEGSSANRRNHNDSGAKQEPLVELQAPGVLIFNSYSRFALCCVSRTAALATIAVILLAVVGNAAGEATDAAAGSG